MDDVLAYIAYLVSTIFSRQYCCDMHDFTCRAPILCGIIICSE